MEEQELQRDLNTIHDRPARHRAGRFSYGWNEHSDFGVAICYTLRMTASGNQIAANLARFTDELNTELARLQQTPGSVTVVAVSKTFPSAVVESAARAGVTEFGENRVQEAVDKIPAVHSTQPLRWHLIGHLQTNKAKDAVGLFDLIHSVDRYDLARVLDRRAGMLDRRQDILIQVNSTAEPQKSGCTPDELPALTEQIAQMEHLRVTGLMTIGPFTSDRAPIELAYRTVRRAFEDLAGTELHGGHMRFCSMGMSNDWRIALAEGANMIRIGRAIFGERG